MQTSHLSDKEFCDYFQPETDREREMLKRVQSLLDENISFEQADKEREYYEENADDFETLYLDLVGELKEIAIGDHECVGELITKIKDLL